MLTSPERLEELVDADGAWNVLLALEQVLGEKAEHLRTNWQDKASARLYESASRKCGALARDLERQGV